MSRKRRPTRRSGAMRRLAGTGPHRLLAAAGAAFAVGFQVFARLYPGWFDGGLSAVILFCATALVAFLLILLLRQAAPPGSLVDAAAVAITALVLVSAASLAFVPALIAAPDGVLRQFGAWVLFASGAALCSAVVLERRPVEG